jgi:hypothetical protein
MSNIQEPYASINLELQLFEDGRISSNLSTSARDMRPQFVLDEIDKYSAAERQALVKCPFHKEKDKDQTTVAREQPKILNEFWTNFESDQVEVGRDYRIIAFHYKSMISTDITMIVTDNTGRQRANIDVEFSDWLDLRKVTRFKITDRFGSMSFFSVGVLEYRPDGREIYIDESRDRKDSANV